MTLPPILRTPEKQNFSGSLSGLGTTSPSKSERGPRRSTTLRDRGDQGVPGWLDRPSDDLTGNQVSRGVRSPVDDELSPSVFNPTTALQRPNGSEDLVVRLEITRFVIPQCLLKFTSVEGTPSRWIKYCHTRRPVPKCGDVEFNNYVWLLHYTEKFPLLSRPNPSLHQPSQCWRVTHLNVDYPFPHIDTFCYRHHPFLFGRHSDYKLHLPWPGIFG